jgi:RHS repeat-associated protein
VTDRYDYDAWGNAVNVTGATPNAHLYRGEQYDSDLGLYYLRERYFNPLSGRFLSRDPERGTLIYPSTFHKYLYTSADPVNRVDPRGRGELIEWGEEQFALLKRVQFLARYNNKRVVLLLCAEGLYIELVSKFAGSDVQIDFSVAKELLQVKCEQMLRL